VTSYDPDVLDALAGHPLARLVHFTPSRNLHPILAAKALRSSKDLDEKSRGQYAKTDLLRLDQHPDHVCCSMQYPNAWYLARAKGNDRVVNFPDWVCLVLDRRLAAAEGALFCHRNAAAGSGAYLRPGVDGLEGCYADTVIGQSTYNRGPNHDPGSPTDVQAEVLIPAPIALSHLSAIVVPTEGHALLECGRLDLLGHDTGALQWIVAPGMFNKYAVTRAVQHSDYLTETPWSQP
jgi:hypothetical protein